MNNKWINHRIENEIDGIKVFCFPHAGGSSSYFAKWGNKIVEKYNIYPVEYPMRERRYGESMPKTIQDLAQDFVNDMKAELNGKFILFGNCLGAVIAFEVAQILLAENIVPRLIVASSSNSPLNLQVISVSQMNDEKFTEYIKPYAEMGNAVFDNQELLAYFLPIVRADFILQENYRCYNYKKLESPIIAINGKEDADFLSSESVENWSLFTTKFFGRYTFPGKHFYLDDNLTEIFSIIDCILEK